MNFNKNDVTIVLPCYNEGDNIYKTVKNYKSFGYTNIIVVNDGSRDKTDEIIKSLNITRLRNYQTAGLNHSILKGLYNVKTDYAFVAYYFEDDLIKEQQLHQFIEFAIDGNYSLLISQDDDPQSSTALESSIRRKFGIFLSKPLCDVAFFNKQLLGIIKSDISGDVKHSIYFEIIKKVIDCKLKVGTYSLGIKGFRPKNFYHKYLNFKHRYEYANPSYYYKYAQPDIKKQEVINQVSIAVLGYILIRFSEYVINFLI